MKFTPHPFKSDLLEFSETDLETLARGNTLSVSGLEIRKERPADIVQVWLASPNGFPRFKEAGEYNLKLTFDGETGKLKSAEVI